MSPIRVLLVDDYDLVLRGLRRLLQTDRHIKVVGTARTAREAVSKAVRLAPHVVTMDLRMAKADSVSTTRQLKRHLPDLGVLALSMFGADLAHKAIQAGASEFLFKDARAEEIIDAIYRVHMHRGRVSRGSPAAATVPTAGSRRRRCPFSWSLAPHVLSHPSAGRAPRRRPQSANPGQGPESKEPGAARPAPLCHIAAGGSG